MKTCVHCGTEIDDSAKYCDCCGIEVNAAIVPQPSEVHSEELIEDGEDAIVTVNSYGSESGNLRLGRERRAKGVLKKIAYLAMIAAIALLYYLIAYSPWGDITRSDFDKITEGMSYTEVCRILGRESDGNMGFYFGKDNAYRTDHRYWLISRPEEVTLYVTFENDIVKSKSWSEGRPYR